MSSILIKNALSIAILKDEQREIKNGWIEITNNKITAIGNANNIPKKEYDTIINAEDKIIIPGLINTHHHFYQTLTRAYIKTVNSKLFDWLISLYPVWSNIDEEAIYLSTKLACAEMMLSGCTTTSDHHYLFPKGFTNLIDIQIEAAKEIGIRFHATRGSMSVSKKDGGLPPDIVVQDENTILKDSERLINKYHDNKEFAMIRIALAPCSPFSVSKELMKNTALLAKNKNVLLHTHLAETKDEENYCIEKFGLRPVDYLEEVGWLNNRTWLAHGIFFSDDEIRRLGRAGVGVSHCPSSNMRLGSGICQVNKLIENGVRVGIGVDGSASNDSSHMLNEVRQAMLLSRVAYGADSMSIEKALKIASEGGAKIFNRNDIASIEIGKAADLAIFNTNSIGQSGADDPISSLLLCQAVNVDTLIINGNILIENGKFIKLDIEELIKKHKNKSKKILKKI